MHGESLFVHPISDLAAIPEDTAVVIVPLASAGNRDAQVGQFNAPESQSSLRKFVRDGGALVVHNWGPGKSPYSVPGRDLSVGGARGYADHDYGDGRV